MIDCYRNITKKQKMYLYAISIIQCSRILQG